MDTIIGEEGINETLLTYGHSATVGSTRLSYENNNSFEINRKKRRISGTANDTVASDGNVSTQSFSSATGSQTAQIAQSPWETRRMKADLIEARARIVVLKKEIEHLNTEMATTQLRNQHKISSLELELSHATAKVTDLEKHLATVRKREHKAKEDLVKSRNQFNLLKQTTDDQQFELQQTIRNMEDQNASDISQLNSDIRDLRTQVKELEEQLELTQDELDTTREINDTLQSKADAYDETKRQLDETTERLAVSESRVKALEFEVGSYEDWKNLSKVTTSRLANVAKMERENQRLKEDLKKIQDLIGNKLLMEEQVNDMKSRLQYFEKKEVQTATLEVRLRELEQELVEWQRLGKDYSQQAATSMEPVHPGSLRKYIVEILQKDVVLSSEQSSVLKEKNQVQGRIQELQTQNEILEKNLSEHKRSLKYHQSVMHRVQKKLQLVIGERDFLKQLLESYEKDLTINQSVVANQDGSMRSRMEMLEKTLAGYQELCQKLEAEIQSSKGLPDLALGSALTSEQYERLRKEIDDMRMHNERLQRRKDELELELENQLLRAATMSEQGVKPKPLMHLKDSPAVEAFENQNALVGQLNAEIKQLRDRIRKLQDQNGELTECLSNTSNVTIMQELNGCREELNACQAKLQMMETKYQNSKDIAQEFREVCYMLFGYQVDRDSGKNYTLSSMYAESRTDNLKFQLNENGSMLIMLETEYGLTLDELVQTHLKVHGSFPAFLSSLTLELFSKSTVVCNP
ncbi:AGAP006632-PA-like protein [Anopheles sinensis]|uniref:AGAP006632-PA-like protein n=1 Tax=Anopheles sinensis TaxID=74873 RepID=A0A084WMG5_ANOSI|nr:AGAP006632-PA-like protein [Anopheles sinensis]